MNLFIDTSAKFLVLILEYKNKIVDTIFMDGNKKHTEQTLEQINKLFQKNQITWNQISSIYVTVGPGSYTGVRVGLTIVKTIKILNSKIKILGINSLLYQLGKNSGSCAISFTMNKYYFANFINWKIVDNLLIVNDDFIKKTKLDAFNYENFDCTKNFLNTKMHFFEIIDINSFKIMYEF